MISSDKINDHNTFEESETVKIEEFNDMKISKGKLNAEIPAKSVILIQVK